MVELRVLGALSVRGSDGVELDALLVQPKRFALLAYLCLATPRGFQRRDTLTGLFWPESDALHARGALRKALHVLRRTLGDGVILTRGEEEVGVDFAALWCDANALGEHATAGRWDEALALYRGDLLPGFFVDDVPELEQWLERERARLRGVAASTAARLADRLESEKKDADAIAAARTALSLAGTDERMLRRLLELLDRAGDRTAAISAYDDFAREVAETAGVKPSAETQALVERIRARDTVTYVPNGDTTRSPSSHGRSTSEVSVAVTPGQDVGRNIVAVDQRGSPVASATAPRRTFSGRLQIASVLVIATVIGGSWLAFRNRPTPDVLERRNKLTSIGNLLVGSTSPDGQFLAYAVPGGDSDIVVVQDLAASGRPDSVVEVYRALTLEWSPDGTQLLVGAPGQALVIGRAGELIRRFPFPGLPRPAVRAYWLPDGKRISVQWPVSRRIILVDLATEDTTSITVRDAAGPLGTGSWSPDGAAFAIVTPARTTDSSALHLMSLDGHTRLLVADGVRLSSPRWSPRGDTIYYIRDDRELWQIGVRSRMSGKVSDLLDLIGPLDIAPNMSLTRDGRFVYLKGERFSNIWLVEPDASGVPPRGLTTGTDFRWGAAVSPDGSSLAFAQATTDGAELLRMPVSGGRPERITFGAHVKPMSDVAWSSDGSELAFVSARAGRFQIAIARMSDGRVRWLEKTFAHKRQGHLSWAPARRIAYQTHDGNAINSVDPVSGDVRTLAADSGGSFASPRYSPDGESVAVRVRGGLAVVIPVDSSMTPLAPLEHWPRGWSDDARFVYSQDVRSIQRIDTQRREPRAVIATLPWRNAQCDRAGVQHPNAFVCVVFDYESDVWSMERRVSGR